MTFLIENETIGLRQYTHADDRDMYACWQDTDTQKGYNGIFRESFETFAAFDISRFRFWVTATEKRTGKGIGTLRLGLDPVCPDLAIWVYPAYRHQGYGTASFRLALTYLFRTYAYPELSAGCYEDNLYSRKMLEKLGFRHYPAGDAVEVSCFDGKPIRQYEFRLRKDDFQ